MAKPINMGYLKVSLKIKSFFGSTVCLALDMQDGDKEKIEQSRGFMRWLSEEKEE